MTGLTVDFALVAGTFDENKDRLFLTGSSVDSIGFARIFFCGSEKSFLSFPQAEKKLIGNSVKPRNINGARRSIKYINIGLAADEGFGQSIAKCFSFFGFGVLTDARIEARQNRIGNSRTDP